MAKRKSTVYHRQVRSDEPMITRPVVRASDQDGVEEIVTMESAPSAQLLEERARELRRRALATEVEGDQPGHQQVPG